MSGSRAAAAAPSCRSADSGTSEPVTLAGVELVLGTQPGRVGADQLVPRRRRRAAPQWKRGRKRRGRCVPGGWCAAALGTAGMLEESMAGRQARGGVLVLGGGFAGAYVARLLGRHGATIVSPENFMLYTPLLPEAASGTLEPRHCVVPLRAMCPDAELVLGRATALDLDARTAAIETRAAAQTVSWEELVIALGAVPRTLPVPGLAEHGLPVQDARRRDPPAQPRAAPARGGRCRARRRGATRGG